MKSMTGYGKAMYFDEIMELEIEIKSLNNRFLDIRYKYPREFAFWEQQFSELIKKSMYRGKIDVKFNFNEKRLPKLQLDAAKWTQYADLLNTMQEKVKSQLQIPIDYIFNEINVIKKELDFDETQAKIILETLQKALNQHQETALLEGAAMQKDILSSMSKMKKSLEKLEELYPIHKEKTFAVMKQNIEHLICDKIPPEKIKDIALEASIYYEKSDVNEEIKRFNSHLSTFLITCENQSNNVGKRLQFILQEMQREINTIGSKFCTEASFQHILICKEEIEKCREMIQNVE